MDITPPKSVDATPDSTAPKRRGRPPGSARKNQDVANAVATMESTYGAVVVGLQILNRTEAAIGFAERAEKTMATNKRAFESSPKLASAVAKFGSGSGVVTFIMANAMLFGGTFVQLRPRKRVENAADADATVETVQ